MDPWDPLPKRFLDKVKEEEENRFGFSYAVLQGNYAMY